MDAIIPPNTDNFMKIFLDALLLVAFVLSGALGLNLPSDVVLIAFLGSFSGSIVLTYFQREKWSEMVLKVLCSSLSGLFIGAGSQEYLQLEKISYIGLNYFLWSLTSLIVLKAFLIATDSNAALLIKNFFQRVFNLQTKEEKEKRKRS